MPPANALSNIALFTPNPVATSITSGSQPSTTAPPPITFPYIGGPTPSTFEWTPVNVSPSAPPVPFETCEGIWKGQFVDMAELLPEARTDIETNEKKRKKKWVVKSIPAWSECFLAYIAVIAKRDISMVV